MRCTNLMVVYLISGMHITPLRCTQIFGSTCIFFWRDTLYCFQAEDGIRDRLLSRGLGDVYKRQEEVLAKIQQAIGPHKDLLTIVKRRKLQLYGHVFLSSGLVKTILQATVEGGRRQGRQRKRWEDNIREWTGLEFAKSQRAVENRDKWRKLVAKSSVVPQRPSR